MEEIKKEFEDLITTKTFLKGAINEKGGTITDDTPFSEYPNQVRTKTGNVFDTLNITENGSHNVKDYKNVSVLVESETDTMLKDIIEKRSSLIKIPYGVTKVGAYVFYEQKATGYNTINEINLPYIEEVGDYSFFTKYKNSLNTLNAPLLKTIGQNAFSNLQLEGEINLPNVETIGQNAFVIDRLLLDVSNSNFIYNFRGTYSFPKLRIINNYGFAYRNYWGNSKDLYFDLPVVEYIGNGAFSDMHMIGINMPNVKTLGNSAFSNGFSNKCKNFILPSSVESIGTSCFSSCKFETFDWNKNDKVTVIGERTFESCSLMKEIKIPEALTQIGNYAFSGCSLLQSILIPSSVTNIGYGSLQIGSSSNKATIIMESETPCTIVSSTFNKNSLNKIYVPTGTSAKYKSATNWSNFADYIVEPNDILIYVQNELLNNENYVYSIDGGKTYNQFASTTLALEDIAVIKLKSTTADTTILIGTTQGGSDVGTIANSELSYATTSGENILYLTIQ